MIEKKRGRPKKFITRSKNLHIMLYEAEYEKFKQKADEMGISVSTFMMLAARDFLYKN